MPTTRTIPISSLYGPAGAAAVSIDVYGDTALNNDGEPIFVGDITHLRWKNPNDTNAIFRAEFKTSGRVQTLTLTALTPEWQVIAVPQNYNARSDGFKTNLDWESPPFEGASSTPGKPGKPR